MIRRKYRTEKRRESNEADQPRLKARCTRSHRSALSAPLVLLEDDMARAIWSSLWEARMAVVVFERKWRKL
jgi:hypothetical protein